MNEENVKVHYITPSLQQKGWDNPDVMYMEYPVIAGKIIATSGAKPFRSKSTKLFADYALLYKGNPIAIVEAKASEVPLPTGIQQAMFYGDKLDVPFVYCSNGSGFVEHDRLSHKEREFSLDEFPTQQELVDRLHAHYRYTPEQLKVIETEYYWEEGFNEPRYYQRRAINETLKHVALGDKRMLLVMATGTGKTYTAFQIIHCLKTSGVEKRILYLADRNILIDQTTKQDFKPFSKFMTKITGRNMSTSAELYMALYHQFYDPQRAENDQPYMEYKPDFFDFIIIDECHRGSAKADSEWHKILEYFSEATQLGMTATPRMDKDAKNDNSAYFGTPIFSYTLKQGIDDGFLAPYMTTRITLNVDQTGYTPEEGEVDENGKQFEDTKTFERSSFGKKIEIIERNNIVARYITQKLHDIGRMTKTLVFCNSDEEAAVMRELLVNLNSDMMAIDERYVMRITGTDKYGKNQLDNFISVNSHYPVIATTVDLLATGVDCKTCGLIVINQNIANLARFKQILGRGTRIREDKGKLAFYVLDFYDATQLFNDPNFDGDEIIAPPPELPQGPSEGGDIIGDPPVSYGGEESGDTGDTGDDGGGIIGDPFDPPVTPPEERVVYKVKGRNVQIEKEQVSFIGEDGKLVTENYTVYARRNILGTYATLDEFVQKWNAAERKSAIIELLQSNGIMIEAVREMCPEVANADVFDVVCYLAFDKKNPPTRADRAEKAKRTKLLNKYQGTAKQIVEALLDKYAQNGILEFEKRSVLGQDPFVQIGSPKTIIKEIGSVEKYEELITEIEKEIYSIA